jgi:hypothetical protein
MGEIEHEQRTVTASRGEALRSLVGGWFASTGAPPAWGLVRYMVCGLVVGAALSGLLQDFRATLLAALTGAVVAASGGSSVISRRVAVIAAGLALVLTVVAFATGNRPVWAALAMAAVALLTSLAAAAGPLGALLGFVGSLAYFLVATMARGREPVRARLGRVGRGAHRVGLCRGPARRLRRHSVAGAS